jgi:hypothetical protein
MINSIEYRQDWTGKQGCPGMAIELTAAKQIFSFQSTESGIVVQ